MGVAARLQTSPAARCRWGFRAGGARHSQSPSRADRPLFAIERSKNKNAFATTCGSKGPDFTTWAALDVYWSMLAEDGGAWSYRRWNGARTASSPAECQPTELGVRLIAVKTDPWRPPSRWRYRAESPRGGQLAFLDAFSSATRECAPVPKSFT